MQNTPDSIAKPTTGYNTAATGGDSVISVAADANEYWIIDWIGFSYADDPTSGSLIVNSNTTTIYACDITKGGPGLLNFGEKGLYSPKGNSLTVTLVDGSQTKKLSFQYR